jgi:cytidylate kinase
MIKKLVITIDGPAAAGKSSAAKLLARRLGYLYLDSGALYRGIAWKVLREKVDPKDEASLRDLCRKIDISIRQGENGTRVFVDAEEVTGELRTPEVTRVSSIISALRPVRDRLIQLQRGIGAEGGVVIEGRDTGTVVFPDADIKFYLDAKINIRGERRFQELRAKGAPIDLETTLQEIRLRDDKDMHRPIAPLKRAEDARVIDSSGLTLPEVVERMFSEASDRAGGRN